MADLIRYMPELAGEEAQYVGSLLANMTDEQAANFTFAYRSQRRAETTFLILSMFSLGRFYLGQIGMGILYVFTASLCFVGAIADLINHKKIVSEYNKTVAQKVMTTIAPMANPFAQPAPYPPPAQMPPAAPVQPPPAVPNVPESVETTTSQPPAQTPPATPAQPSPAVPNVPGTVEMTSEPEQEGVTETPSADDVFDALERLASLHERGILTEEEFQAQKDRLLKP